MTGWDATALMKYQLADGTSYAAVVAQLTNALGALNAELANDPLWGSLLSYTDRPEVQYRVGSTNGMERHTEYGRPDAQRAATEGHMLPLVKWDRALGWTHDYLEDAMIEQIQADIASAIEDTRTRWRLQVLGRLLQRGDDSGALNGLGAAGYSPGFATAAASTSVDFTPPTWGGGTFTSDHEHYVSIAGGALTSAAFQDIRAELREHGHQPPYDVLISSLDETTVRGLTGFVPAGQALIAYGASTTLATFGEEADEINGSYYIGVLEGSRIRVVPGWPQYYAFGYKSYGLYNPRNPLRVRLPKDVTRPRFIAMTDPRAGNATTPIQYLLIQGRFGVGIGSDRTNGTPRYVNNSTWADGTAT